MDQNDNRAMPELLSDEQRLEMTTLFLTAMEWGRDYWAAFSMRGDSQREVAEQFADKASAILARAYAASQKPVEGCKPVAQLVVYPPGAMSDLFITEAGMELPPGSYDLFSSAPAAQADSAPDAMAEFLQRFRELHAIQAREASGDDYMRGMFNGMELAMCTAENRDPQYVFAPKECTPGKTCERREQGLGACGAGDCRRTDGVVACATEQECTQEPWCRLKGECQRNAGGAPRTKLSDLRGLLRPDQVLPRDADDDGVTAAPAPDARGKLAPLLNAFGEALERCASIPGVTPIRPRVVGRMRVMADLDGFPGVVLLDAAKSLPPGDYELIAHGVGGQCHQSESTHTLPSTGES